MVRNRRRGYSGEIAAEKLFNLWGYFLVTGHGNRKASASPSFSRSGGNAGALKLTDFTSRPMDLGPHPRDFRPDGFKLDGPTPKPFQDLNADFLRGRAGLE
jgi:hypothetical protein